jgi:hypothetical protein
VEAVGKRDGGEKIARSPGQGPGKSEGPSIPPDDLQPEDHLPDRLAPGAMKKSKVGQRQDQLQGQGDREGDEGLAEKGDLSPSGGPQGQGQKAKNNENGQQEKKEKRVYGHRHGTKPEPAAVTPVSGSFFPFLLPEPFLREGVL